MSLDDLESHVRSVLDTSSVDGQGEHTRVSIDSALSPVRGIRGHGSRRDERHARLPAGLEVIDVARGVGLVELAARVGVEARRRRRERAR